MKRILLAACAVLALSGAALAREGLPASIIGSWCFYTHNGASDAYERKKHCDSEVITISQTGYESNQENYCKFDQNQIDPPRRSSLGGEGPLRKRRGVAA